MNTLAAGLALAASLVFATFIDSVSTTVVLSSVMIALGSATGAALIVWSTVDRGIYSTHDAQPDELLAATAVVVGLAFVISTPFALAASSVGELVAPAFCTALLVAFAWSSLCAAWVHAMNESVQ